MATEKLFTKKRWVFLLLFMGLVFVGRKINFSPLVGADNQFFTLFQFFGPIAGSFLGPLFGGIAVLGAELVDFFAVGKALSLVNLARLAPMIFAAYYFGTRKKESWNVVIPILAMAVFILHPVGREVWFFTLFWLIPVVVKVLPAKYSGNLALKSLGATFAAHSVGGALWIWTVPMTAGQWIALIPIVAYERLLFAGGIAISFIVVNAVLDKVVEYLPWEVPSKVLHLDKGYVWDRK